eukprot:gene507-687_t
MGQWYPHGTHMSLSSLPWDNDFAMQLRYQKTVLDAWEEIEPVSSIGWSKGGKMHRMAVTSSRSRVLRVLDAEGEVKDKFSTKPRQDSQKQYVVRCAEFSPCGTKLAIAQSDNIVFVYKIGEEWGDKKSICNKFTQSSSVTCMVWPSTTPGEIFFGLTDGKVKIGRLKLNKSSTLNAGHEDAGCVVSICVETPSTTEQGTCRLLTGHAGTDGSWKGRVYKHTVCDEPRTEKIATIDFVPLALGWGVNIFVAGNGGVVQVRDPMTGDQLPNPANQRMPMFDYKSDPSVKAFTCACVSPSGQNVALGNDDGFFVFSYVTADQSRQLVRGSSMKEWRETSRKKIGNVKTISALSWKNDGSSLCVGDLRGGVHVFAAALRRVKFKNFECTYTSLSQVVLRNTTTGKSTSMKSNFGYEILKLEVFKNRFAVLRTAETLIVGDLESLTMSEIQFLNSTSPNVKFNFDNPHVCLVWNAGELSIIEYNGQENILCSIRTEYFKTAVLSVQVANEDNKKVSYLLDPMTISIKNVVTQQAVTINHDSKIDWLEMNPSGSKLLFRDKRRSLHLYDVYSDTRKVLLNFCNYVQWVPDSDVVVAQSHQQLLVWYSIEAPDQITVHEIKGDVDDIERANGRTCVIVEEGVQTVEYVLDEELINFGVCVERQDYAEAVQMLENMGDPSGHPEIEAKWRTLSELTTREFGNVRNDPSLLIVAERCAAVLGNVARARYLSKLIEEYEHAGEIDYKIDAKLQVLNKEFAIARNIYVDKGDIEGAISMYSDMQKFEEALRIAESKGYNAQQLRQQWDHWLLNTNQYEKAAELAEGENDLQRAINLYIQAGMGAKAAQLFLHHRDAQRNMHIIDNIVASCQRAKRFDKAGELYEFQFHSMRSDELLQAAYENYVKGHAYRQAVELAKREKPEWVKDTEEKWGDWLVEDRQLEAAVNHYLEARCVEKVIDTALKARLWNHAQQLLEEMSTGYNNISIAGYWARLAQHYAEARQYDQAERCFLKSSTSENDGVKKAVEMYLGVHHFEQAVNLCQRYLNENDIKTILFKSAESWENTKPKLAEDLYYKSGNHRSAMLMWRRREDHNNEIRALQKCKEMADRLKSSGNISAAQEMYEDRELETRCKFLGDEYQKQRKFPEAEHYYLLGKLTKMAVDMHLRNGQYDNALRIPNLDTEEFDRIRLKQAMDLFVKDVDQGVKFVRKNGMAADTADYLVKKAKDQREKLEKGEPRLADDRSPEEYFNWAFRIAKECGDAKIQEVHLQYGIFLEDEEKTYEAEEHFLLANRPDEAIAMWTHLDKYDQAHKIADQRKLMDQKAKISEKHGEFLAKQGKHQEAEDLWVAAKMPQLAVLNYQKNKMTDRAAKVCEKYCDQFPDLLHLLHNDGSSAGMMTMDACLKSADSFRKNYQIKDAIKMYLNVPERDPNSKQMLVDAWLEAYKVATESKNYILAEELPALVNEICRKMEGIQAYASAAELCKDYGLPPRPHEPRIDCLCKAIEYFLRDEAERHGSRPSGMPGSEFGPARQLAEEFNLIEVYKDKLEQISHSQQDGGRMVHSLGTLDQKLTKHIEDAAQSHDWQQVLNEYQKCLKLALTDPTSSE